MKIDADFIARILTNQPLEQESREDILALIKARRSLLDYALNQLNELERLLLASPVVPSPDAQVSEVASVDAEVSEVAASIKFDATLRMCVNAAHKFFETHEFNEGLPNSQVLEEFAALSFEHCPQHLDFLRDDIFKVQAFIANKRNSRDKRLKRIASLYHVLASQEPAKVDSSLTTEKSLALAEKSLSLAEESQTLQTLPDALQFFHKNSKALTGEGSHWEDYLSTLIDFVNSELSPLSSVLFVRAIFRKVVPVAYNSLICTTVPAEEALILAIDKLFDGQAANEVLIEFRDDLRDLYLEDYTSEARDSFSFICNTKNSVEDRLRRFRRDASSGLFGQECMTHYGEKVVELYIQATGDKKLPSSALDINEARGIFADLTTNIMIVLDDFPFDRALALNEGLTQCKLHEELLRKNSFWQALPKLSAASGRKREFCVVIV